MRVRANIIISVLFISFAPAAGLLLFTTVKKVGKKSADDSTHLPTFATLQEKFKDLHSMSQIFLSFAFASGSQVSLLMSEIYWNNIVFINSTHLLLLLKITKEHQSEFNFSHYKKKATACWLMASHVYFSGLRTLGYGLVQSNNRLLSNPFLLLTCPIPPRKSFPNHL